MAWFSNVDWNGMFIPDTPLLEIFIRGSVIYLSLFILLRLILKRQAGSLGVSDLLVIVLIADAAQNGMAGDYRSLPDGVLLVATLIFWNYTLERLGYHFPRFEKLIQPSPLALIQNGRLLRKNMRTELVTEDDLMSQIRLQGHEHLSEIKEAYMEGDGKISIIPYEKKSRKKTKKMRASR